MYEIKVQSKARKEILRIPPPHFQRIKARIDLLAENPRPDGAVKLKGETAYRIRVGNYRILYEIDDAGQLIIIYRVKHRRDVYRSHN